MPSVGGGQAVPPPTTHPSYPPPYPPSPYVQTSSGYGYQRTATDNC